MNILDLYDQFTTTWERIRANILSHVFAFGLLWLVGFELPLPNIDAAMILDWQQHPTYPLVSDFGLVAIGSLAIALFLAIYTVALRELGGLLLGGLILIFPPSLSLSKLRRLIPDAALFPVAATLESGEHDALDLEQRVHELIASYSVKQPEETKRLIGANDKLQRDASTHLRNATVFLSTWIVTPLFLSDDASIVAAIKDVYWKGLLVLLLYLLLSRTRLLLGLRLAVVQLAQVTAMLVTKDEAYAERLKAARENPEPYRDLVRAYKYYEREESAPSLIAFLRYRTGLEKSEEKPAFEDRKLGPIAATLQRYRQFGWDQEANRDYEARSWLVNYLIWRLVRLLDHIKNLANLLLQLLGVRPL